MSISEKIKNYAAAQFARFHTPGHKGKLSPDDITELYFSDDYFNPQGIIRGAMDKVKAFYGSAESFLLVNGSSVGILAAVYAVKPKSIIIAANSHQCVYNAAKISGAKIHAVQNIEKDGILYPLTAGQIKDALVATDAEAVVVTSPDYFGLTADTEKIHDICREHNAVLIADSAHGAHFPACNLFPKTYADIYVASAHKTMPALTQGAYLNVFNPVLIDKVRDALYMFTTTSPSYLIMSSLEYAVDYTMQCSGYYFHLAELIAELCRKYPVVKNDDFTRLVIDTRKAGGGEAADKILRENGVISEKVFGDYIIFIITLADNEKTIAALDNALAAVFG